MLELNGELLKPLDEARRTAQQTKSSSLPDGPCDDNIRRRVELGSVKFDADVSGHLVFVLEDLHLFGGVS